IAKLIPRRAPWCAPMRKTARVTGCTLGNGWRMTRPATMMQTNERKKKDCIFDGFEFVKSMIARPTKKMSRRVSAIGDNIGPCVPIAENMVVRVDSRT
ncbi:MAG: hypothetical protein VW270_20620, partial [Candidatus Poseidoniales archaeon]